MARSTAPKPTIQVVCAWCGKMLEEGDQPASHGICPECFEQRFRRVYRKATSRN